MRDRRPDEKIEREKSTPPPPDFFCFCIRFLFLFAVRVFVVGLLPRDRKEKGTQGVVCLWLSLRLVFGFGLRQ